jgi:hypothetical protein
MRVRKNPMTPLAAVVAGLLAGAEGTVCLGHRNRVLAADQDRIGR